MHRSVACSYAVIFKIYWYLYIVALPVFVFSLGAEKKMALAWPPAVRIFQWMYVALVVTSCVPVLYCICITGNLCSTPLMETIHRHSLCSPKQCQMLLNTERLRMKQIVL